VSAAAFSRTGVLRSRPGNWYMNCLRVFAHIAKPVTGSSSCRVVENSVSRFSPAPQRCRIASAKTLVLLPAAPANLSRMSLARLRTVSAATLGIDLSGSANIISNANPAATDLGEVVDQIRGSVPRPRPTEPNFARLFFVVSTMVTGPRLLHARSIRWQVSKFSDARTLDGADRRMLKRRKPDRSTMHAAAPIAEPAREPASEYPHSLQLVNRPRSGLSCSGIGCLTQPLSIRKAASLFFRFARAVKLWQFSSKTRCGA